MKFFEAVPDELFSPLASPNRALYADALDVLYTAYREKLKLPEDMLYSMLRSRLEQQLAEATFEGEDIDEDELRDISGRARFLIRKLGSKGWFEKERGTQTTFFYPLYADLLRRRLERGEKSKPLTLVFLHVPQQAEG